MYQKENANDVVGNLEYYAERPHLLIPEYGLHLQKLIVQATEIEDRSERNKAAQYIIKVMGSLNPHLRDALDFQHKLWDHIFIMSDFKLDVDSPYPIPTKDVIYLKPDRLDYPQRNPKYRFYGNNIKFMIDIANSWEEGELKDGLVMVIANHMKKSYLSWNKDTVEDQVIFEHLLELSGGRINLHQKDEELSNTTDLMKTNKKVSNKMAATVSKNQKIQSNTKKPIKSKKPFVKNNFKN